MMRDKIKKIVYSLGLLTAFHKVRNKSTLTVVMFHRVLPVDDVRWRTADPEWTVTDTLFEECLGFFQENYHVVTLDQIVACQNGGAPLPDRALLITFDDGWADNEEYALDILKRKGVSGVVFVVTGAIGKREPFWQEQLYAARRLDQTGAAAWVRLWQGAFQGEACAAPDREGPGNLQLLIERLGSLQPEHRTALLSEIASDAAGGKTHMLSEGQLLHLHRMGMAIGSHGATHNPITQVEDPLSELRDSSDLIRRLLDGDEKPVSLSFPHGKYDASIAGQARETGYQYLFTSDACLNPVSGGAVPAGLLGRIHVPGSLVSGTTGALRPELLALWLFTRPIVDPNQTRPLY